MSNLKVVVPEATTNLCVNPSFETGTDGWTTSGTNTIARSAAQQRVGNYSLLVTYGNNPNLALHAITLPNTNTTYTLTAEVFVTAGWDGGNIQWDTASLSGVTLTAVRIWTAGTDEEGVWLRIQSTLAVTNDVAGTLLIETSSAPTAGKTIYIDAVQIEELDHATTYCDGDQDDCTWSDKVHGSASSRPATSRAGGRVRDLRDDFGLPVKRMRGMGMAPVANIATPRALLPGRSFQRAAVSERVLTLFGTLGEGTSLADLYAQRQALIGLVAPDTVPNDQPFLLRYTGAAVEKQLAVRYHSGLELGGPDGYTEQLALQLLAVDPFWEALGETAVSLGPDSATMRLIVARIGGEWNVFGPPHASGTYTAITAIAVASPNEVYVGGSFANFDNDALSDNLAVWNGTTWEPVDSGITPPNGKIVALVLDPAGNLYIGGAFTALGTANGSYIVRWTGSAWEALGTPSSGATITGIYAVAVDPLTGNIWVGGDFQNLAGIAAADNIAYWDGSSWNAAGASGANGIVYALTFASDGNLYVGGAFTSIAGVSAARIARRNPAGGWSVMGSGFSSDATLTIAVTPAGAIYAGGEWASHGHVAQWRQGGWRTVGGGMDDNVRKLLAMPDGTLIAVGAFTTAGGNALADGIAVWDGGTWSPLPIDLPGSVAEGTLANWGNDLYIGTDQSGTAYFAAGATAVTNSGTARAYPIIEVANEGTGTPVIESITNLTTGRRLLFKPGYVVLPGDRLRLDLRPGRIKATDKNGAPLAWPLAPGSDVAEFHLLPGTNELTAYSSPSAPADLKILLRFRPAYWSID